MKSNLKTSLSTKIMKSVKAVSASGRACRTLKAAGMALVAFITVLAYSGGAFASDFDSVVDPIVGLIDSFVNPMLALVGAGGTLFCIMLGVKFATAEEPQEKEKRKQALKTAIIGFVLIFVLIVALKLSIGPLTTWMNNSTAGANTSIQVTEGTTTN